MRIFDEIEYPVLLHCKSGADRAGFMSTLYPVCVANAHDQMPADQVVAVSGQLILVSGLGGWLLTKTLCWLTQNLEASWTRRSARGDLVG